MSTAQHEFGRRLRDEREHRGLTLEAIADSTKIPLSLLAGLERGDVENWPHGLFGRAHLRNYAATVGLSSEPLIVEFLRLSGSDQTPTQVPWVLTPSSGSRLTLAEDRRWAITSTGVRALASAVDLCAVFAIAMAIARILHVGLSLACAVVGLTYFALGTVALGQSVTLWWVGRRLLQRTRSTASMGKGAMFLVPRRRRDSRRQQGPTDFREKSSASAPRAASR